MDALKSAGRRWRREAGAELVEFALILPVLLFVIAGIVDFGFLFRDYLVITNAAREGARVGVLANYLPTHAQARARTYIDAAGLDSSLATIPTPTYPDVAIGGTQSVKVIRVEVTFPHTFYFLSPIAGLFGDSFGSITLRAVSMMRVEGPS